MLRIARLFDATYAASVVPAEAGQATPGYPNRPIRMVVPFAAGGPGDMLGQLLARELKKSWGQPVNVEIRHGINGIVGSDLVAKAPADGYTIAIAASAHYINPSIYKKLPFDSVNDFAAVTLVAGGPNVLVVHPSVPAKSISEFIAYAKANPGRLKYASGGHGSPSHLAGELFNNMAGVKLAHVPYKGHAAAGVALSEGREVQLMFDAIFTCIKQVQAGKWRALGVSTLRRNDALPDIPTISESGLPGYEVSPAMGVLAPAATPPAVVEKLSGEIARILRLPEVAAQIRASGAEPVGNTPSEYAAYVKSEIAKWAKVVREAGIEVLDTPQ